MSAINDDGGPAFPQTEVLMNSGFPDMKVRETTGGMTLRDWFAGNESIAEYDDPEASIGRIGDLLAGPRPVGGWGEDPLVMLKWEAKWRAELKYLRADAMIAARKGGSHE